MKSLFAVASAIVFSAVPAFAAEGTISNGALAKMGLQGMQTMSDDQGMAIRGQSATVGGFSLSTVGGVAQASSLYYASGPNSASGFSASVAATNFRFGIGAGASFAR